MIIVTGGCGFIGSNFIEHWLANEPGDIQNIDCMSYVTNWQDPFARNPRVNLHQLDLSWLWASKDITRLINDVGPTAIVHFAAETHVDNSIANHEPFLKSNVIGTVNLLDGIKQSDYRPLLIHVSTDEVFGSLGVTDPPWVEDLPYHPNSPYSASKAASEHFVTAYGSTWGLPYIITNCGNNYGPWQHVEKFIPKIITNALKDEPIPVYGNGLNKRDWIYVTDHCAALRRVMRYGVPGQKYNIGGTFDRFGEPTNVALALWILDMMGKPASLLHYVDDRPGHDLRYALDTSKIRALGWAPVMDLRNGLLTTIEWYKEHR